MLAVQVLLRALRDFNLGKLTADDTGIFMGLLNDLFPKTVELVPRAIDREFEPKASMSTAVVAAPAVCTNNNPPAYSFSHQFVIGQCHSRECPSFAL